MKTCHRLPFILLAVVLAVGPARPSPGTPDITLQVTAELAIVREKPDIMSAVLKQFITGAVLEAQKKDGEWYEVKVDQDTGGTIVGYVHESLVRVVAGAPVETRRETKVATEPPPEKVEAQPVKTAGAEETPETVSRPKEKPARPEPAPRTPDTPRPAAGTAGRASVTLWYGGQYAVVGDLNDGAEGMAAFFASRLGTETSDNTGAVHLGGSFGAEYRHPLAAGLYGSVSAGLYSARNESTLGFEGRPETTLFLTTPMVRAIPFNLSLVFYPAPGMYLKAGAEIAFARCEYLYRFEEGGAIQEWRGKANDVGLGYALAGGLEWTLSGPVSVLAEAGYRKLRVGSLEGEELYSATDATDVLTEGTLYFSRGALPGGASVAQVFVRSTIPGGTGVVEARKAEVSFSGLSLRLGLKFEF